MALNARGEHAGPRRKAPHSSSFWNSIATIFAAGAPSAAAEGLEAALCFELVDRLVNEALGKNDKGAEGAEPGEKKTQKFPWSISYSLRTFFRVF